MKKLKEFLNSPLGAVFIGWAIGIPLYLLLKGAGISQETTGAILSVIGLVLGAGYITFSTRKSKSDLAKQISKAEAQLETSPGKAKPAWDLARATLEEYFNRNLTETRLIFGLSLAAMGAGLVIIYWGITQAINSPSNAIPIAVITAAAGVVTEFIGATFLIVYRSTVQQTQGYSHMLERINSVGMAMLILDSIPDGVMSETADMKSKTRATLVETIVKQSLTNRDLPSGEAK